MQQSSSGSKDAKQDSHVVSALVFQPTHACKSGRAALASLVKRLR